MHLHLPKPLHGWRQFVGEVGIIVLGVLIALSFEQLVQEWRWREDVRSTRQSLVGEIENASLFAIERLAVQQCVRDRIGHLEMKLNGNDPNWAADPMLLGGPAAPGFEPTMPVPYGVPHSPFVSDIWDTAKSTGVVDHMNQKEAHGFEFIFTNIERLRTSQDDETATIPQLSFLSFSQRMDSQLRAQSLVALGRLDVINSQAAGYSRQLLSTVARMHLVFGRRPGEADFQLSKPQGYIS